MASYFNEIMHVLTKADRLGSRQLSNGTRLIGHVPHVAPEAYFHVVYAPLNDAEIRTLEQQIGRPLPRDLKHFYGLCNGLKLFSYALAIDGLRRTNTRTGDDAWHPFAMDVANVKERPKNVDDSFVFFGGYEWDGSTLGMSGQSREVHRCAPQSARRLNTWASLSDMLCSEVRRLSSLFNADGHKVSTEVPTTPEP